MQARREKRSVAHVALGTIGVLSLFMGALMFVFGLWLFADAFMTPTADFFAQPLETMDDVKRGAALGTLLFSLSTIVVPFGLVTSLVAFAFEADYRARSRAAAAQRVSRGSSAPRMAIAP